MNSHFNYRMGMGYDLIILFAYHYYTLLVITFYIIATKIFDFTTNTFTSIINSLY